MLVEVQPKDVIAFGQKSAQILKQIVSCRKDKVMINGKQYLQFQDWQTIAKFYRSTVGVEWTKPLLKDEKVIGYEAKANVLNEQGIIISSAESSCARDEKTWAERPDFQLRSMAQTRACAKALRNIYSWVVVLAGYEGTPEEEMVADLKPLGQETPKEMVCSHCGVKVKEAVYSYSLEHFGRALCYVDQNKLKELGNLEEEVA